MRKSPLNNQLRIAIPPIAIISLITKPVIFNVKVTTVDDEPIDHARRVLVKATTSINRADFGMDELTTVVEGNVQLCMSVEALKYEA